MATVQDRKQTRAGRFYHIEGRDYPSVTTILNVIGKPALLQWMAKTEREMVMEVSADLYETVAGTPKMSKTAWLTTLQDRIGKAKAGDKEKAKAAEIGTQAHKLIEWNLRKQMGVEPGPEPKVEDKALWSFMAWEDWAKMVSLKPIHIEQVVYSESYGYAGTMDLYAEVHLAGLVAWFAKRNLPVPAILQELAAKKKTALAVSDWKTGKAVYSESYLQNAAYRHALREMGHGDPELGLIVRLPKIETDPEFEVVVAPAESECLPVFLHFLPGWVWAQKMEAEYDAKKTEAKKATEPKPAQTAQPAPQPAATAPAKKRGPMAPVPAVIPPLMEDRIGRGLLESFSYEKTKTGKVAVVQQTEKKIYVLKNTYIDIGGKKKVPLYDILELAVGQECVFVLANKKVSSGSITEAIGALKIGPYEWEKGGTLRAVGYQATNADLPETLRDSPSVA